MEITIDLRSDTVTKPTPAMRQAMAEAEVGDDVFGEDPTVNALQEKVAAILGKEKALFVPSGTMANQFRKMFGGGMRQAGILAAAGIYALDHHRERLAEDHQNAMRLAQGLSELKGVAINPEHVETNIAIFDVISGGMTAPEAAESMKKKGVLIHAFGKTQVRLVTHLGILPENVEMALAIFRKVFR